MNPRIAELIDWAFQISLWSFLVLLLLALVWLGVRIRQKRRRSLDELFEDRPEREEKPRPEVPVSAQWRAGFRATLFALTTAALIFLAVLFLPLPGLQNFAAGSSWQQTPLRVTSLDVDRFYEGFSVSGEVWNQTDRPLESVILRVLAMGEGEEVLGQIESHVRPDPLPAGSAGEFQAEFREKSPLLTGYRLIFQDKEGDRIPHVNGFDVR